ncbi:MAG: RtcB family protein [Acidobacteriaceae bacterium]
MVPPVLLIRREVRGYFWRAPDHCVIGDHIAATAGVECRKDADVIDETPMAYKSISAVMEAQKDLVEIVHTLRQVVCVKG